MTRRLPAGVAALAWCVLWWCGAAWAAALPAIPLHHTSWTARDGAPASVLSIAQTADGWLWLASPGGLYRFDGVRFEQFAPAGAPLLSRSLSLVNAFPGNVLWIGYRTGGAGRLQDGRLRNYGEREGLPRGAVWGIERDGGERIWAATPLGMYRLENQRWLAAEASWGLPAAPYKTLMRDRHGVLWAQGDAGVYFLRPGATRFTRVETAAGTGVLFEVGQDAIVSWNAVQGGLRQLAGRALAVPPRMWGQMGDPASMTFDRRGNLWIGQIDGVEYRTPQGRAQTTPAQGLSGRRAGAVFEDREGNIWTGTDGGIDRFSRRRPARIEISDLRWGQFLLADDHGGVLLGGTQVNAGDSGQVVVTPLWPAAGSGWTLLANSATRTSDGVLWVSTYRALRRVQGRSSQDIALPPQATGVVVPVVLADRDDSLLVSLRQHGLYRRLPDGQWQNLGLPADVILMARSDQAGLWLASADGRLIHRDGGGDGNGNGAGWRTYGQADGLSVGVPLALHLHGQHVWVGGDFGLALRQGARFGTVRGAGGEAFEGISGIVELDNGDLWLNAADALFRIPADQIARLLREPDYPVAYERLDQLDGLEGAAPRSGESTSMVRAADGRLWLLRASGLYRLDPAERLAPGPLLPVIIKTMGAPGAGQPLPEPPRFAAGTSALQIDYTVPALAMPERVRFRYRLDAGAWQEVGERRSAYFSNLGAGDYRFQVAASDYNGRWPEHATEVRFSIAPATTETWWFRTLCVAALLAAAWLAYRAHIRRVRRQLAGRLQERVGERERIARELHDTLLQSVQGLILHVHAAAVRLPDQDSTRQALETALRQADHVVDEGRGRIRDLRGDDAGKLSFADAVLAAATRLRPHDAPPVQLQLAGTAHPLDPTMQEEALAIITEAIGNAYRHAGAGRIDVELQYGARELRCVVRDDGAGIPPEVVGAGGRDNHWGMRGMHERARRIKAKLSLRSGAGGTEWLLVLPAALAYTR